MQPYNCDEVKKCLKALDNLCGPKAASLATSLDKDGIFFGSRDIWLQ